MKQMLQICCKNNNISKEFPIGSSLLDIYYGFNLNFPYQVVSAKVNNRSEGLNFRVYNNKDIEFLDVRDQSGMRTKAHFITARIFGEPFKVIKIDKAAVEYYTRLTALYSQYRGIAVNYNQVVKALNTNFSEKKALAFLYKLEKATMELADLNRQIIELTREFETRWLQR